MIKEFEYLPAANMDECRQAIAKFSQRQAVLTLGSMSYV